MLFPWYVRIWDDNYVIAEGYVLIANTARADDFVALGRVGEYRARNGVPFHFLGGGACALVSNALVRTQGRIMGPCLRAAELWYSDSPHDSEGFDPVMPECPPGRYGCEDVVISYCLRKELGTKLRIVQTPGFNHVDAETLNARGLIDCRGLACRRKVISVDNSMEAQLTIVLHWVKTGSHMMHYDSLLYGQQLTQDFCDPSSVDESCSEEMLPL
jgi:hypothetical protein